MRELKGAILLIVLSCCLQGCSFDHRFEIMNPTDRVWNVEYEILDPRGVFRNKISIRENESKEEKTQVFEGSIVRFSLNPNESADLFWIRNTCYDIYKKYTRYHKKESYKSFINVRKILLSSGDDSFTLDPTNLSDALDKNSRNLARINIGKLVKSFASITP